VTSRLSQPVAAVHASCSGAFSVLWLRTAFSFGAILLSWLLLLALVLFHHYGSAVTSGSTSF